MKVLKFGGTSVGAPERMHQVADLVNNGEQNIVVLSAISGTTNSLVEISQFLYQKNTADAISKIDNLRDDYKSFVIQLYSTNIAKEKGAHLVEEHFKFIKSFTKDLFTIHEEKAILAQGELLSTALFQFYLEEQNINSVLLPALDFMRITEDNEPDMDYIRENLNKILGTTKAQIYITQGFICRNTFGEVDNLKRGGSDYTASLIGAAIGADEIQIWTDIDGMHNNDPRIVENTYPIRELSFDEAAELAYFGAKILHPSSIRPAKDENIPVRLKNTMSPQAQGTLISQNSAGESIKAVAAKDEITAIKIKSGRMLMAYGFLRAVFEIFERYKTPIDMITTSEVGVSLTIDDTSNLDQIIKELKEFGAVEVDENQTIVCVVGDNLAAGQGYASKVFDTFREIPIRMISFGGSKNNVSILIDSSYKRAALIALNKGLFNVETV